MVTPPGAGWAPRIPCGLCCSRRTRASRSLMATVVIAGPSCLLEQPADAGHRNGHPIRAVVELVLELVDRLLKLEDRQQVGDRGFARGQQRRIDGREVLVEEPVPSQKVEALWGRTPIEDLRRRGGVGKGPQHARDVT